MTMNGHYTEPVDLQLVLPDNRVEIELQRETLMNAGQSPNILIT